MRSLYIHHWVNELYLNFYLVPCLIVHAIWQLKYRLFCRSNHINFLLFLTYSFMCSLIFVNMKIRYFEYI